MVDELKFYEGGVKMIMSVGGFAAGGVPGIAGTFGFVSGVIGFMKGDATADGLTVLKQQVDQIRTDLDALVARFDEFVLEFAIESNRQTMARLTGHLDTFRLQAMRLSDHPQDLELALDVANTTGVLLDEFLRDDFEIWRWTDVVEKRGHPDAEIGRFKSYPTLPVYAFGILTWLAARERIVQAGNRSRLHDDTMRINRHLRAVSVRGDFDKYADGDASLPTSIAEHTRWRIRSWVISSNPHPQDRTCRFFFEIRDWMANKVARGDPFDRFVENDDVLCTIDPSSVGAPRTEIDWETQAGVDVLAELARTLGRVAITGSVKEQFIGEFGHDPAYPPAILYLVALNGDLLWYRNEQSSKPGGSSSWAGPNTIGAGWHTFTHVFSGGGAAMYGIRPDGALLWHGYDGFIDGAPRWRTSRQVGVGWHTFRTVFSAGEYIIYAITPEGDLRWYRHAGAGSGGSTAADWEGPNDVGTGWGQFAKVFSGGSGVIYAIDQTGKLFRALHKGYLDGTNDWEPLEEIGIGWDQFIDVAAAADGVIYAFKRDGTVLWARYGKARPEPVRPGTGSSPPNPFGEGPGIALDPPNPVIEGPGLAPEAPNPVIEGPALARDGFFWEGPVSVKDGVGAFITVFAEMDVDFVGPH